MRPDDAEDDASRLPSFQLLRRVFPFVRPHLLSFSVAFALGILSVAMILQQPVVLKNVVDENLLAASSDGLFTKGAIYLGLLIGSSICGASATIILGRGGVLAVNAIKRVLFDHFLTLGLPWVERYPVGKLVSRIESDSQRLVNLCSTLAMRLLSPLFMIGGAVVIIYATDRRLFWLCLSFVPLLFVATWAMFSRMRPRFREERRLYSDLTGQVAELVPAARLLQALGRGQWARARLAAENDIYVAYNTRLHFLEYGFWSGIGFIEIVLTALGLWLGAGWVADGSMTTGTLVMFAQYAAMIYWPVLELSDQLAEIQRAGGAADRIFGALDLAPTIETPAEPKRVPSGAKISFESVGFEYDEGVPVLRDLSFDLEPGRTVALVGATGSGKTTVINLLMRFRDPTAGCVRLGGIDLREFDPHEYRRRFGLVLQDLYLFPASVRENLRAFRDEVTDDALIEAARTAGILEALEARPGGLDAVLAEGGADLSYGERQLLAFARALAVDPEFLVLDEATSSVDPGTELRIQETLERLTAQRSSLIVAHRLSTIRRADLILVLDRGEVIERGDHASLIARGGSYADLVRRQEAAGETEGRI